MESKWLFKALRNTQSNKKEIRGKGLAMLLYLERMADSRTVRRRSRKAVNQLAPYHDKAMP